MQDGRETVGTAETEAEVGEGGQSCGALTQRTGGGAGQDLDRRGGWAGGT